MKFGINTKFGKHVQRLMIFKPTQIETWQYFHKQSYLHEISVKEKKTITFPKQKTS